MQNGPRHAHLHGEQHRRRHTDDLRAGVAFRFSLVEGCRLRLRPATRTPSRCNWIRRAPGPKSGQISFTDNDSDENPFSFSITGTVTNILIPEITVLGNGFNIADGDTTPAAPTALIWQRGVGWTAINALHRRQLGYRRTLAGYTNPAFWITLIEGLASSIPAGGNDTFHSSVSILRAWASRADRSVCHQRQRREPIQLPDYRTVNATHPTGPT